MEMEIDKILNFWFDEDPQVSMQKWWNKDPMLDQFISDEFNELLHSAVEGDLDGWLESAEGTLAYIILLDQFSRNIYRNKPHAFAQDNLALQACLQGLSKQFDKKLTTMQRYMFYMPLMHVEDLELQQQCVELFENLLEHCEKSLKKYIIGAVDFAKQHMVIIERFGRFPHRNDTLARESTRKELAFLQEPNSSF